MINMENKTMGKSKSLAFSKKGTLIENMDAQKITITCMPWGRLAMGGRRI